MIHFHNTSPLIKMVYPSMVWQKKAEQSIYLTFDDGPDGDVTPWVLQELNHFNAKATFFCLGKNLKKYPELTKRIIDEGHLIANHTYSHLKGWSTNNSAYLADIDKCDKELIKLGVSNNLFRPPYGRIKRKQLNLLKNREIVMWNRISRDFDPELNIHRAIQSMKKSKPGSILLFHDSKKAFGRLKSILPEVLNHFNKLGLTFSTLHD